MKLFILKADNSKEMNNISEELAQEKFKITQQENHYILMKKKRYGNYAAHMFFLFIGLFLFMPISGIFFTLDKSECFNNNRNQSRIWRCFGI